MASLNAVIDISHHNGAHLDFVKAKAAGVIGVIHKATQGLSPPDPLYAINKKKALDAGLLWGAYHFASGGDGVNQAEHFLDVVGDTKNTLLVLDFEPNLTGPTMDLEGAHAFLTHVDSAAGQWPGFYSGSLIKQLLGATHDSVLAKSWFWLAQYGPTAVVPPTWKTWTMWQYTDGAIGADPKSVDGIGLCDRDKFNGTAAQLRKLWGVT